MDYYEFRNRNRTTDESPDAPDVPVQRSSDVRFGGTDGETPTADSGPTPPPIWFRVLYSATLATAVFPLGFVAATGWVALILGTSLLLLPLLLGAGLAVWRVIAVWRYPNTLGVARVRGVLAGIRWLAVIEMLVGCLAAILLFLQKPIVAAVTGGYRSEDGIEFVMFKMMVVMIGGLGLQGLLMFEWTRLIEKQRAASRRAEHQVTESPAIVWLTGIALAVLVSGRLVASGGSLLGDGGLGLPFVMLMVSLPLILTAVVRIRSLLLAPAAVPLAAAQGFLGVLRRVATVCLVMCLLGAVAMGLAQIASAGASILGVMLGFASLLLLPLAALEAARLLGFERQERAAAEGAS
jgi:hypothetical protein